MHILNSYALNSASKIDKPFILEKYFPLTVDKYITLQPYSKGAKTYDWMKEVISLIFPVLQEAGITIVQVGGPNEAGLDGCYQTQGQTNINQLAYIIKGGLLHAGVDSIGCHLAGGYNKKIVGLYSNNYINCVRPYWGKAEDQILLEPERKDGEKPSFSLEENPKSINTIKPEKIAAAICDLLGLEYEFPYKTVSFGNLYNYPKLVEMTPNTAINISNMGIDSIIVRMDFLFNEAVLANQMQICPVSIVTNRPINLDLLTQFKPRIKQLIYIVDENHNLKFAEAIHKSGINFALMSHLSNEELNKIKFDYMELGLIHRKDLQIFDASKKYFYKTNKYTLGRQKIYASHADYVADRPVLNLNSDFLPILDNELFRRELEYFYLTEIE